jgi:hypothetical protein
VNLPPSIHPRGDGRAVAPTGLGYLQMVTARTVPGSLVADGIALLEGYARRCGLRLGEVFVEAEPFRRLAWSSLVAAARATRPVAVLMPGLAGLRLASAEVAGLEVRLRRATNAPLVVVLPAVGWVPPDVGALASDGLP